MTSAGQEGYLDPRFPTVDPSYPPVHRVTLFHSLTLFMGPLSRVLSHKVVWR